MWLDDLVILMEDADAGEFGVDLFTSTKTTIPFLASGTLAIIETANASPERTQNAVIRPAYINVAAQFVGRGPTYAIAKARAQAAYDALVGIRNVYVTDDMFTAYTFYREITPMQEPFDGGVDPARGQARCVFNVKGIRRTDSVSQP